MSHLGATTFKSSHHNMVSVFHPIHRPILFFGSQWTFMFFIRWIIFVPFNLQRQKTNAKAKDARTLGRGGPRRRGTPSCQTTVFLLCQRMRKMVSVIPLHVAWTLRASFPGSPSEHITTLRIPLSSHSSNAWDAWTLSRMGSELVGTPASP